MPTLDKLLTNVMICELEEESDEPRALRKALLHALVLLAELETDAAAEFREHVLRSLPAVASYFQNEAHPYVQDVVVMRGVDAGGRPTLFLPAAGLFQLVVPPRS